MDQRQRPRYPRRLYCEVSTSQGRAPGIVRDVSHLGLFVQTQAMPSRSSVVELIFKASACQPAFRVEAGVARTLFEAPEWQTSTYLTAHGIGLEVIPPRTAFERWIVRPVSPRVEPNERSVVPLESMPRGATKRYRVRLIRQDRPGSQVLTLSAESEFAARTRALARFGVQWRVVESQSL